jgi:pSer/pThr/pTyr-binding forkhead associated (FHA) protein
MAYLVVTVRDRELFRRELSGPLTLGRSTDCELWLNDNGVSRRHCRFEQASDGAWEVHDLGSRNGVFAHGQRVAKHTLRDGDHVRVGEAKITFHEVGYVSSRPATPQRGAGDSMSDTVLKSASRVGRALPTPRAVTPRPATPGKTAPDLAPAPEPAAPLAFQRPPARPMPVTEAIDEVDERSDGDGEGNGHAKPRESFLRRLLHK